MSVINRINTFNKGRIEKVLPYKYDYMAKNMYSFFRGTCHLFYEDLANTSKLPSSPLAWLCGDLHLENFGSYRGTNQLVYFDLNDFDDAILGPACMELARMVTSIFIAFEALDISNDKALNMAKLFLKTYSNILQEGKSFYIEPQISKGITRSFLKAVERRKLSQLLKKRTIQNDNELILKESKKQIPLENSLKKELINHLDGWILNCPDGPYNYESTDVMFRLAGTGSVGLKRYIFLLKNLKENDQYLLVDMKQVAPSSLKPFIETRQPEWESEAERVVNIQKHMQNVYPSLLSRTTFQDELYFIQELQPAKDRVDFRLIKSNYRYIYQVIDDMAILVASAQIRSSGYLGAAVVDELIAFGQNNQWQEPVLNYAVAYAKKIKSYYNEYVKSYAQLADKKNIPKKQAV